MVGLALILAVVIEGSVLLLAARHPCVASHEVPVTFGPLNLDEADRIDQKPPQ